MLSKFILLLTALCSACNQNSNANKFENKVQHSPKENLYKRIKEIPLPHGYSRLITDEASFGSWLENVSLKKDKTVYEFDGSIKYNQAAQFAVLNISVGKKNLQQCADAVMRLRAEYLYEKNDFDKINFTDNDGTSYLYKPPYTRKNFDVYLDRVFGMCGTASLSKQLKTRVKIKDVEPGDVLIRGGFPGHAVIVMDVAINSAGSRIFLLAQSYMPAQGIHVLNNPSDKNLSPWYEVNDETIIETPEYTFRKDELKRW